MRRVRLGLWLIAGGMMSLGARSAEAWSGDGAPTWQSTDFPLVYSVQRDGSDDVDDGSDVAAVERAFAAWAEPGCTSVIVARDADLPDREDLSSCFEGGNRVQWEESDWPEDLGSRVLAVTLSCFTRTQRLGTTMRFNGADHTWSTRGVATGSFDIAAVATHEAGHVLGLGHSDDPEATMFRATAPGSRDQRSLELDDVAGICALYPLVSVGAYCTGDTDCEGEGDLGLTCRRDWTGGYCTAACEADCPGDSLCARPPGEGEALCLARCVPGGTCRSGTVCHTLDTGLGVCAPPCRNDEVCAQGLACVAGICQVGQAGILDEDEIGCTTGPGPAGLGLALVLAALARRRQGTSTAA